MAAPTLQDLLTPRDQPTIEQTLLSSLQAAPIVGGVENSFPVTDWEPGGFERTTLKMTAAGLADRENLVQMLTAAGYLDLASTIVDGDGNLVEGWAELLASQGFGIDRGAATFAQQSLVLTCTNGPGPYTRAAGEIVAYSPSTGNKYANVASVTIPNAGSVVTTFQAQSPGSQYQDPAGSIIALITPMPGVSVSNPLQAAGIPVSTISGTGSIAVTSTAVTPTPRTIALVFTTGGQASDASAQYTLTIYQGTSIATTGPFAAASTVTIGGDVTLTFADGPGSTQSYDSGDTWTVTVPGSPLLQTGSDAETLAQLVQECHDRFPSLSDVPTMGRIEGLVFACSKAQGLGIVKVRSSPSADVAGVENVYIAGTTATATPTQVAAVQSSLNAHASLIGAAFVAAASPYSVTVGGIVKCRRGTTGTVQTAADKAWAAYIAAMAIGGNPPDGLIEQAALIGILMAAGALNVSGMSLNGYTADLGPLTANLVAVAANAPSAGCTWQEAG
jgi:hypothetical protein